MITALKAVDILTDILITGAAMSVDVFKDKGSQEQSTAHIVVNTIGSNPEQIADKVLVQLITYVPMFPNGVIDRLSHVTIDDEITTKLDAYVGPTSGWYFRFDEWDNFQSGLLQDDVRKEFSFSMRRIDVSIK